jgi:(S)-mandelate dehydrogenase
MMQMTKSANFRRDKRKFPSIYDLRRGAMKRLPRFAFEYGDGGAGNDAGIAANWAALDAISFIPRYGVVEKPTSLDCNIFGRAYSAPFGVAPMGSPIIVWPGADKLLAAAAQRARVPYILGIVAGATIEEIVQIAPDVTWLQMYRFARDNHAVGLQLLDRAAQAGVHALVLTLDTPIRTVRPREIRVGLAGTESFSPDWRMVLGMVKCPAWGWAMRRNNMPKFANLQPYAGPGANLNRTIEFAREQMAGTFSWEEIKRYRDWWKRPLVLKGILHPDDAEKAISIGIDGLIVSNHGGRQVDALATAINCLPAIVRTANGRLAVFYDSGIRSGSDVARALALGADAVFAGKAFLWGLGALGARGPDHVLDLLYEELQATLGQIGVRALSEVRAAEISKVR